jgi:hypothetical protein
MNHQVVDCLFHQGNFFHNPLPLVISSESVGSSKAHPINIAAHAVALDSWSDWGTKSTVYLMGRFFCFQMIG